MTMYVVTAYYDAGFGELAKPPGEEPITRAKMLTAGCCANSSDFTAEVEADSEDEAVNEAIVAIARQAAWRGITKAPISVAATTERVLVVR